MSAPVAGTAPATPASGERPRGRRVGLVLLWVAIGLVVVFGVLVVWAAGRGSQVGEHLRSPDDPSPGGAMALAQVLEQQGVDVQLVHSFWEMQSALGDGRDATLLVDDDWWVLTDEAYQEMLPLAEHLVIVQPTDAALARLAPGVEYAGFAGGTFAADCALPAAQRAGRIAGNGDAYTAPASATRCYADGQGGSALVRVDRGTLTITVLGLGDLLGNDTIASQGDAALALGLLGEQPRLVWYQPDVDDYAFEDSNSLAAHQGPWFLPLVVLLLLVGVAAAVWRGRRMGPVVVEDLPVVVRSSETMEGRA
ncbi:DUF4350 domain-containing protein, partial [Schumannella luteola]